MSEQQPNVGDIVPRPPEPRAEVEITADWEGDINKPVVSIQCITYNHALYIENTLNSLLMQETDFPFEIWVHDDASTDGTQEIIRQYQRSHPNIVKAIFQEENQYSKGVRPTFFLKDRCLGKYCALCEGDDYWRDPRKIQKQVDYLELNPDCVISSHDAFVVDEEKRIKKLSKLPDVHKRDYSARELSEGRAWILTMSWVYRNVVSDFAPERHKVHNGDAFFTSILGQYGYSHYHSDITPAVYRVHADGVWSSLDNDEKFENHVNTWFWMYRYYKRIGCTDIANEFLSRHQESVISKMKFSKIIKEIFIRLMMLRSAKIIVRKILGERSVSRLKRVFNR